MYYREKIVSQKVLSLVKYFSNLFFPSYIYKPFLSFVTNHFSPRLVLVVRKRTRLHIGEIVNE